MANEMNDDRIEIDIEKEEQFVKLLLRSEREIFKFILTLVPHLADAEDLLQETCSIMWRKLGDFEPGTNFTAWGISIARYRVLNYRRRMGQTRVVFNEELIARIAERAEHLAGQSDERIATLHDCITKLRDKDREMIHLRYFSENSTRNVAEQLGRSIESVYKSMSRIHDVLLQCVRRTLRAEARG